MTAAPERKNINARHVRPPKANRITWSASGRLGAEDVRAKAET
jgi:hypothetical protein